MALLTDELTIGQFNQKIMSLYASLNAKSVQANSELAIRYDWGRKQVSGMPESEVALSSAPVKKRVEKRLDGVDQTRDFPRRAVKKADWSGFSMYGFIDHRATTAELAGGPNVSTNYGIEGVGRNAIAAGFGLEYGAELSPDIVGFAGVSYDLTDTSLAKFTTSGGTHTGTAELKEENRYSFYVGAGPLLTPSTLLYGKLSYNYSDVVLTSNVSPSVAGLSNASYSTHGLGYGAGIRQLLDKYFLGIEFGRINYSKGDLLNASSDTGTTTGMFYVGRKF